MWSDRPCQIEAGQGGLQLGDFTPQLLQALPRVQGNAASTFGGIPAAAECCRPWSGLRWKLGFSKHWENDSHYIAMFRRDLMISHWDAWTWLNWAVAQFSDPIYIYIIYILYIYICLSSLIPSYIFLLSPFPHDFPYWVTGRFLRRSFAHWSSRRSHSRRELGRRPKNGGFYRAKIGMSPVRVWISHAKDVEDVCSPKKGGDP